MDASSQLTVALWLIGLLLFAAWRHGPSNALESLFLASLLVILSLARIGLRAFRLFIEWLFGIQR